MLFSDQRKHHISLPSKDPETGHPSNVAFLIHWLCENLMKDPRRDMFVLEGSVYVFSLKGDFIFVCVFFFLICLFVCVSLERAFLMRRWATDEFFSFLFF